MAAVASPSVDADVVVDEDVAAAVGLAEALVAVASAVQLTIVLVADAEAPDEVAASAAPPLA